jgi:hypothetical protein
MHEVLRAFNQGKRRLKVHGHREDIASLLGKEGAQQ